MILKQNRRQDGSVDSLIQVKKRNTNYFCALIWTCLFDLYKKELNKQNRKKERGAGGRSPVTVTESSKGGIEENKKRRKYYFFFLFTPGSRV